MNDRNNMKGDKDNDIQFTDHKSSTITINGYEMGIEVYLAKLF